MRKAIRTRTRRLRLALPAVAAAAAFGLTGCGDGEAPFGAEGGGLPGAGGGGDQELPGGGEGLEGLEDIEIPGADGGATGDTGDTGGEGAPEPEDTTGGGGSTGGGGGGGGTATVADMEGSWYTGFEDADSSLSVSSGTVSFIENTMDEGDVCSGTATDGMITLDYCTQFGSVAWSAMTASVELSSTGLTVTWEDGTVHEYSGI
jgi:hypothetical protein